MCRLIFGKRNAKGNPFGSFQAQPAQVAPNYQNNYQPIYQTQQQHYQTLIKLTKLWDMNFHLMNRLET